MNATVRFLTLALAGALLAPAGAQELFKWVDKDGKVHFSDTPPPSETKNVQQKRYVVDQPGTTDLPYAVKQAMESNPVTLYANNCDSGCAEGRALLAKRGIPYADKNPETDTKVLEKLKQLSGGKPVVPVLTVGDNVITGFAEGSWQSALDAAGYPRTNPNLPPRPAAQPASPSAPTSAAPASKTEPPAK